MKRRRYLALSVLVPVAGCSDQTEQKSKPPTPPPLPQITLTALDTTPENPTVSLKFVYNVKVRQEIPTDPPQTAEGGMKWLILRANVTNRGKKTRNLEGNQYVVLTDTRTYQFDVTLAEWELAGKKAAPGETVTGWLVFRIPSSVRNATLSVKDSLADDYAISFSHDNGLDVGIPK